jgi:FKBP-type peptidyl-prolyl cis-trans isomerase
MLPGLSEGIQLMVLGETRRLWIPEALSYKGQQGNPKGTLVFDVTLVDMPTRAPANVKAPDADAKRTASGLAYQVLKAGTGTRHPKKVDEVTVHYTGWTTDGKMFDRSVIRGEPATFPLDRVMPGWTEGVQLMVEGEKTRFWIPQKLAYQGNQPPFGMLVFDIELIKIH